MFLSVHQTLKTPKELFCKDSMTNSKEEWLEKLNRHIHNLDCLIDGNAHVIKVCILSKAWLKWTLGNSPHLCKVLEENFKTKKAAFKYWRRLSIQKAWTKWQIL